MGLGPYAGAVGTVLVNCIFLSYLFSIYAMRHGGPLSTSSPLVLNRFSAPTTLAALLLFWAGLSLLWTPHPATAAAYFLANLVLALISYMLCKLYPISDVFLVTCKGTAYAAAASTPLSIVLIGFSSGRLGGVNGNSMTSVISSAGILGTICVVYLFQVKAISKYLAIVFFSINMASLYLTFNKTGIIAFVMAAIVFVVLAPGDSKQRTKRVAILLVGLTLALYGLSSKIAEYATKSEGAETLSGRTILWASTYKQIVNGPYIRGYGETAFLTLGPGINSDLQHFVHPHNEFLAIWFNFGLVGVVLVYSAYFALANVSLKAYKRGVGHPAVLVLCVVINYLVYGIASASFSMCLLPIQWLILYDCLLSRRLGVDQRFGLETKD